MELLVCIKQVPDTSEIKLDPETNNLIRTGLPSIVNPYDMHALEAALVVKDQIEGSRVTVVTMGPPQAEEALRQCLALGADDAVLVTDRAFGGADTLATSYVLAQTIRKMGHVDLVIGGRQAIDGDTAQVGPQVAQKLDIDQVTYVEQVEELDEKSVTVTRRIDGGVERVKAPLPVLLTVTGSAASCRPRNAKLMMKYKRALAPAEQKADMPYAEEYARKPYLTITQWGAADIDADIAQCGLAGSPTKVKTVQNVVFATKESRTLTGSDADVEQLIVELLDSHTIG